jgi:hypothetical protein
MKKFLLTITVALVIIFTVLQVYSLVTQTQYYVLEEHPEFKEIVTLLEKDYTEAAIFDMRKGEQTVVGSSELIGDIISCIAEIEVSDTPVSTNDESIGVVYDITFRSDAGDVSISLPDFAVLTGSEHKYYPINDADSVIDSIDDLLYFDFDTVHEEVSYFTTDITDLVEIGRYAVKHYYSNFMGEDIKSEYRIITHGIDNITLWEDKGEEFTVEYSANYTTGGLFFLRQGSSYKVTDRGYRVNDVYNRFTIRKLGAQQYQIVDAHLEIEESGYRGLKAGTEMEYIENNLEIIMSSPKSSSNPNDYIKAHQEEYKKIVVQRLLALRYLFSEFDKGSQTGLRGAIILNCCRDILGDYDIDYEPSDPQDWYEAYKPYINEAYANLERDSHKREFLDITHEDSVGFSSGMVEIARYKLSYRGTDTAFVYDEQTQRLNQMMMYRAVAFYYSLHHDDWQIMDRYCSKELLVEFDKWRKGEEVLDSTADMMRIDSQTYGYMPRGITDSYITDDRNVIELMLKPESIARVTFNLDENQEAKIIEFYIEP